MKNILKLGSIALALPLMLAPLCHAQTQWSSEQPLGGDPASDPYAIQVPGTNILQVFYQGTDNGLWTRWRNPAVGSTPAFWSDEAPLGGQLSSSGSNPVAIQLPGTNIIQVFYRGANNALWSVWRNPADGNTPPSWSPPQNLGGILAGDPAVAQIPGTNTVQVFYQGADHAMYTRGLTNGTWSKEQGLGGSLFTPTCGDPTNGDPTNPSCYGTPAIPVPIQIPNTNDLAVFYRGSDNHLRAFTSASWTPRDFGGYLASDPSAAPVPGENQIQVFYQLGGGCSKALPSATNACQAIGGGLMTQWGNPENLSSWTHETQMAGHLEGYYCSDVEYIAFQPFCDAWSANYATPKAYTQPGTNTMFVIYPGADGGVWASAPTLWGQERTQDGTWHSEFNLGTYSPTTGVGASNVNYAQVPGTNTTQIFYTGFESNAWSGSTYGVMSEWTVSP
jgi:hypothetical protein